MSPLSNQIESLAARYRVPVLEAQEFWAERAAIREFEGGFPRDIAEQHALEDLEIWARVYLSIKGPHDKTPSARAAGAEGVTE